MFVELVYDKRNFDGLSWLTVTAFLLLHSIKAYPAFVPAQTQLSLWLV